MGANSKIEWCHHTFNPWRGCTKVSDGCKNCYAETLSSRNPSVLGAWGPKGTRVIASESMWMQPLKWNAEAEQEGVRKRVFCGSLCDVFEGARTMPAEAWLAVCRARERLFHLIKLTPHLDWLLLTKRPENISSYLPVRWRDDQNGIPDNVWLGTSVENQKQANKRIPELVQNKAKVLFISGEPLLGLTDVSKWLDYEHLINWVICGGESGPNARPMHPDWARSLRDQCVAAGVPFLFKQWGEWAPGSNWPEDVAIPSGISCNFGDQDMGDDGAVWKVGKRRAGRLLDGQIWDQYPEVI